MTFWTRVAAASGKRFLRIVLAWSILMVPIAVMFGIPVLIRHVAGERTLDVICAGVLVLFCALLFLRLGMSAWRGVQAAIEDVERG